MRVDAGEVGVLWQDHAERVPAYAQLALQVLVEARRGSRSPLAPYIAMLPTMEELDGYAPAASWSDEELDLAECEKLTADAVRLRSRRSGGGHPALEPTALASKWAEGGLPGVPPTADELAWAVTVVTSRAYGVEAPDGGMLSLLIPMVDMCNHNHPPHTAKGLEKEGDLFVVIATEAMKKGEQVFLSYGGLPNLLLLVQFGFVAAGAPTDMGLVDCAPLVTHADASRTGTLTAIAEAGYLMRDADGSPSRWQPASPQLQAALEQLASAGELPDALASGGGGDGGRSTDAATGAYRALLRQTLNGYTTSIPEDAAALEAGGLPPRTQLALEFRLAQKKLLNSALAASAAAPKPRQKAGDEIF